MSSKDKNIENKSHSLRQAQRGALGGVWEAFKKPLKILVIQQKMIGDVLTSSLICENLKLNFPDAEVHYLVNRFTIPVIKKNPYIDELVIFEDEYRESKLKFYKFLKSIKKKKYTHVFDVYGKIESILITAFSDSKYKYGLEKYYSKCFYSKTIKLKSKANSEAGLAIENRLRLLKLMEGVVIHKNKPKIYLSEKEVAKAKRQFELIKEDSDNCIIIGAMGSSINKTYPFDYFAEILDFITSKTEKKLLLNYMPSQQTFIDDLLSKCNTRTNQQIIDGIEVGSLRNFMALCSICSAVIGNEGGAINIAKALDVPTFSIFSPWIIKEGWNSFEINYPNRSVHLSDFENNLHHNYEIKHLKNNYAEFYAKLKPDLFLEKLNDFLKTNLN